LIIGGAVAVVAAAVVLMVVLTRQDTSPPPNDFGSMPAQQAAGAAAGSPASGAGSSSPAGLSSADRKATNVAVLNGTTQTGLARTVADKIGEGGYTIGSVTNNADQSVPTTVVSYNEGNEKAAFDVAKRIGIDRGSVQRADANTSVAADADVVVTVGSDQIG
jgi:hypothetical protein